MLSEILSSISYFGIIYIVSLGYGAIFNKYILRNKNFISNGELGLFGLFFLSFISISIHFFLPINYIITILICSIGIFYFFYFNFYSLNLKNVNFLILIFILPTIILFEYHADYFWYHLPYINITSEFKIIFGLANINDNLGYSHIWYDLISIFNIPYYGTYYVSIISVVFLYFFLLFLKNIYISLNDNFIKIFVLLTICFVSLIYTNSKDYGSEIQVNLIYIIISFYILIFYKKDNDLDKKKIISKIIIFFFFSFLIRTNSIIFLPLLILFLAFNFKKFFNSILNNKTLYAFIFVFLFLYIIKNIIISGCISYPIYFTCFDFIDWGVGSEQARLKFYHLSAQSKGYLLWLINENLLKNMFDYYIFRETDFFISPENYLRNKNWIKYWWLYEYDVDRFLNIFYFFIIFLFITYIFNIKKVSIKKMLGILHNNFFKIILFSASVFSWIYLLPQTRYGGYGIIFIFLGFICLTLIYQNKKINLLPTYFLLFISCIYFQFKNLDRIHENFTLLKNNSILNFYTYPSLDKEALLLNYKFDILVSERKFVDKKNIGKPLYCYDTRGLCGSTPRINCIREIKQKNNYIYIKPDKKLCASLTDNYLWY